MNDVLKQLGGIRPFCETRMSKSLFKDAKDKELLNATVEASSNKYLWQFIAVVYRHVIEPLEKLRRWGLKCTCCEHLRAEGNRHPQCPRASRKLHLVAEYLRVVTAQFSRVARNLELRDVEGNHGLMFVVRRMLQTAASALNLRAPILIRLRGASLAPTSLMKRKSASRSSTQSRSNSTKVQHRPSPPNYALTCRRPQLARASLLHSGMKSLRSETRPWMRATAKGCIEEHI